MNVFLLYGNQSARHFPDMLISWKTMLANHLWNDCCFVLVTDQPIELHRIPADLQAMVMQRSAVLPHLGDGSANEVGQFVSRLIGGPGEMILHCLCFGMGRDGADGDDLHSFIKAYCAYYMGHPTPVLYLMLSAQPDALPAQTRFASQLYADDLLDAASAYLLSEQNEHMAFVPMQQQLRILICELALLIKNARIITHNTVYSLGYSVLNANSSELEHLERSYLMENWLVQSIRNTGTDATNALWQVLCPDTELPNDTNCEAEVRRWIGRVMGDLLTFPGETERRNNRILGGFYQNNTPMDQMRAHILSFFELNLSTSHFDQHAQGYFAACLDALTRSPFAADFNKPVTLSFLRRICEALQTIASVSIPPFRMPALPAKRFLESQGAYADRCCDIIEAASQDYCKSKAGHVMAEAMAKHIQPIVQFISSVQSPENVLMSLCIPQGDAFALRTKYPNITKQLQDALLTQPAPYQQLLIKSQRPLFTPAGSAIPEAWDALLQGGVQNLCHSLQTSQISFFQRLNVECATAGELDAFINQYISRAAMILHFANAVVTRETKYLVDQDLQNHPWTQERQTDVFVVQTDNIERIDRVSLPATMGELLHMQNRALFPYFVAIDGTREGTAGHKLLQGLNFQTAEEAAKPEEALSDTASGEERPHMHMQLNRQGNSYYLSWEWPPFTTTMYVRLEHNGQVLHRAYPVNNGEALNLRSAITGDLPYGPITVTITGNSTNGIYYADTAVLRGARDIITYQLRNDDGKHCLTLRGRMSNIHQLLLECTQRATHKRIVYPISPVQGFTYGGLSLPGDCQLIVNPAIDYPSVEVH